MNNNHYNCSIKFCTCFFYRFCIPSCFEPNRTKIAVLISKKNASQHRKR